MLAGPTCDGDDVIYRRTPCALPLDLRAGDVVDLLCAGAYTSSYASVGFNGFGPLPVVLAAAPEVRGCRRTGSGFTDRRVRGHVRRGGYGFGRVTVSFRPDYRGSPRAGRGGPPAQPSSRRPRPTGRALPLSSHPVGRHVLAELGGIDPERLDDTALLRAALSDSLVGAGAQVRQIVTERFSPQGATVVAVLAESHASVHTWPELGGMHVDVFTCGDAADPVAAVHALARRVGATETRAAGRRPRPACRAGSPSRSPRA